MAAANSQPLRRSSNNPEARENVDFLPRRTHPPPPLASLRSSLPPKRKPVAEACEPCRAHKIKCDANRPKCTPCVLKARDCAYASDPGLSRYAGLKRRHSQLEQRHADLVELFDMLKSRPEQDARIILNRIRTSGDLSATLSFIKEGELLSQTHTMTPDLYSSFLPRADSPFEAFLQVRHGNAYNPLLRPGQTIADPTTKATNTTATWADTGITLTPGINAGITHPTVYEDSSQPCVLSNTTIGGSAKPVPYDEHLSRVSAQQWTAVTDDNRIFADIISIYLSYDHPTFRVFDEEYFLEELARGGTDYCSPLLVNAILAYGSCNYKEFASGKGESLTIGFYQEARRHWNAEESKANLLQIPAAMLLNM
ncbi:hypothetical protein BGZ63DRAFT_138259 [Mariannaea sp. PMI_226]|nr:hypothetical protein BGZ63DRAFT_138259 [Mariannaea sp. PMI_226]